MLAACSGSDAPPPSQLPDSGTLQLRGASVPYVVEGEGLPCLVFGSHLYYPRTFSAHFKSRLRCVHLDQRGFIPDAPAPEGGYTVAAAVADIEAAREAFGLDRFVLVGHSMHGTVALAYALAHPSRVLGVVAIGSPPTFDTSLTTVSAAYWEAEASEGRRAVDRESVARLTPDSLASLSPGQQMVATYIANRARYWADSSYDAGWLWEGMQPNPALVGQLFDFANPYRLPEAPAPDAPPALVALGHFDFVVPPTLWRGRAVPFERFTLAVFERSGHTPQLEEPAEFDGRLDEWLATLPRE